MDINPEVDQYIADGCGRCKLFATPQCRVRNWQQELETLRQFALESELTEEVKWGVPVYTLENKNVIMISALKAYCAIAFFKGALLNDTAGVLFRQGENTQSSRTMKFTSVSEVIQNREIIKDYIQQAIEIEKSGAKVIVEKNPEPIPEELTEKFKDYPEFKKAFFKLTPGKQRAYILHFSEPVRSETRKKRIKDKMNNIENGIGLHDAYRNKIKG